MTPGRVLGAAVVAVVVTGVLGAALEIEPGSTAELASGFVVLGSAVVAAVALVWLLADLVRRRQRSRDAGFAALDQQPARAAPVVWVIDDLVQDHDQVIRLRELDGTRTLVARVDGTSELHAPAPPVGTEVVLVSDATDTSIEFVNAGTYHERDPAPEDDWVVLAHLVGSGREQGAADAPAAPPAWPSA